MSVSRCQQQAVGSLAWLQGHWRAQGWWLGEGATVGIQEASPRLAKKAAACSGVILLCVFSCLT